MGVLRIAFVTQFFPPSNGAMQTGGTISNRNLLRALAERWPVTVLSFDTTSAVEDFHDEPYQVVSRPPPRWRGPDLFLHWMNFVREESRAFLHDFARPPALIGTTSTLPCFDAAPEGSHRVAIVQAYENFGWRCPHVPASSRISLAKQAVIRRFQDVRLMRKADGILTNSSFMKRAISERFKVGDDRISIMPQLCDIQAPAGPAVPDTIGFVHRGADKNIALVLELARRAPDLQFRIFGHSADLPLNLPPNASFLGWASDRQAMFESAALWLVPSLWSEPFGRVSIEAQAADRAVLVVNRGGLPETVFNPRFVIDGFDAGAWLQRVRELLQLPPASLASNGQRIREAFSPERHDSLVIEAMTRIIDQPQEMRLA